VTVRQLIKALIALPPEKLNWPVFAPPPIGIDDPDEIQSFREEHYSEFEDCPAVDLIRLETK
jgi:hypothetical protein